jgi:hypothetical protein
MGTSIKVCAAFTVGLAEDISLLREKGFLVQLSVHTAPDFTFYHFQKFQF